MSELLHIDKSPENWSEIFSIPDDSIVSDGTVDPMGMQVIWTDFGQRIFNNKLTTVSTDIRNFTINLLHHSIIYTIEKEQKEILDNAQSKFSNYNNYYDVKAGIIIFLEDLLVYSLISQSTEVETLGLLGSYNAEKKLSNSIEPINIEAEKSKGVLVRQITLGVNGRYKGPFINMDLFKGRHLNYNKIEWEKIVEIINNWSSGNKLFEILKGIIVYLLEQPEANHPQVYFSNFSNNNELQKLYKNCFGSNKVHHSLKSYWEENLGLKEGAAKSIYQQFIETGKKDFTKVVIENAKEIEQNPVEKRKLNDIIVLEPFLSACSQIFYILTDVATKRIDDLNDDIEDILNHFNLEEIHKLSFDNNRLKVLLSYVEAGNKKGIKIIQQIILYHEKIMKERGASAWIELRDNSVKHYINQKTPFKSDKIISNSVWYHSYYIDTVFSIYKGLNSE